MNLAMNFSALVDSEQGMPTTSSLRVAEVFKKNHRDVLRAIKKLECSKGFTERNFALSEYVDATGRKLPYYNITKDGFVFLAMGFTGKEAAKFKEDYINAFNWMHENLIKRGMSLMQRHNFVSLKYDRRKEHISDSARNMRSWQDEKPLFLEELEQIEKEIQPYLPNIEINNQDHQKDEDDE